MLTIEFQLNMNELDIVVLDSAFDLRAFRWVVMAVVYLGAMILSSPRRSKKLPNVKRLIWRFGNTVLSHKIPFVNQLFLAYWEGNYLQIEIHSFKTWRLYNKESVINKLLSKSNGDGFSDHIKKLRDVKELRLSSTSSDNQEPQVFYCPVTGLEMSGIYPFVYLWSCGCVFSRKALTEVSSNLCMLVRYFKTGLCSTILFAFFIYLTM